MTERTTKQQRLDLAFAALLSDDDAAALTALTRIGEQGDARAIPHLLGALAAHPSPAVQQRITALLHQVKAADAVPTLIAALDDDRFRTVRRTVLSAFWSAGLDARDHLERFIAIAVEGSAEECFECLTVIENQELWPEKAARLGLARVRKAIAAEPDPYKGAMLKDLAALLEERLGAA
ncbi:MAG: HEAT repeat domain-containing protein [Flavobacteriales bacterium]|jgi:hypothetical protein|nr:MAG: HEAT repeat domain-containing protein [Flavobacteriales bacterium]